MRKIAIIGGGCSGVLMALSLLKHSEMQQEITIFDPTEHLGQGVAYSTRETHHLLNVPAGRMGLWSDDHGDFCEWIKSEGLPAEPADFVPRMWFAKYLFARLEDEKKKRAGLSTVIHVRTLIQNVSLGATHGWVLTDSLGVQYQANKVILALGLPNVSWPRGIAGIENSRQAVPQSMHVDSWSEQALKHVTSVSKILLLGSGLTTVDTILSLRSNGVQAPITVLSRHGRFPTPHFISPAPSALTLQAPLPKTLKNVMKKFRELSSEYRWDAVIDAFRPHIPDIWSDFTQKEQDRFRRHIQPLWDIHRHRMAPKIWENIATQLKKGDLCVVAGRLKKVEPVGRQIATTFQRRRRAVTENEQFDFVINCTGFGTLDGASYGGLLSRLIEQKIVTLDPTGTGVRTVAKNTFRLAKDMYVLGALLRAERWESIAVPELRQQASDIARQCFV